MNRKKIDPKLKEMLEGFSIELGKLIDRTLDKAETAQMDMCLTFDTMSHLISQRVGQLDTIHVEMDLLEKDPEAKIDRERLEKIIDNVQLNALYSISIGMNDVLKAGGHYTIDELKSQLMGKLGTRNSEGANWEFVSESSEGEGEEGEIDSTTSAKDKKTFH